MEVLNNPWVVGLGGGIVSGLFVAWVTRYIFSKRDSKEYLQKIRIANQEVIYAIRPGISEGVIPSAEVVRHLIAATARRYDIESELMYSVDELASELMKEVMDSSFISASVKQDFCEKLSNLVPTPVARTEHMIEKLKESQKSKSQASYVMSLMAGLMTGMAAFTASRESDIFRDPEILFVLAVPALAAILISLVSVFSRKLSTLTASEVTFNIPFMKAKFRNPNETNEKSDSSAHNNQIKKDMP